MSSTTATLAATSQDEYQQRLVVERLRRAVFALSDPAENPELIKQLEDAELELSKREQQRVQAQRKDPRSGQVLDTARTPGLLGPETTGLDVKVHLRMRQVPTAICHLFDATSNPLLSGTVKAVFGHPRRIRITCSIEGYSATAVETIELTTSTPHEFQMLPLLFLDRARTITEVTRASLNVKVEDLDQSNKIEIHVTHPIWMLARTSAPLAVLDPTTGALNDMSPYFGAFVTPNAPKVIEFQRAVADILPGTQLVGYQIDRSLVEPQVRAIFEALKQHSKLTYVNSVIAFTPESGATVQRVRLPSESLAGGTANCIDGTVLFASLLESFSLNPAIVVIPGHAFVAWETWNNSDEWRYLETTMIGTKSFEDACAAGEQYAASRQALQARTNRDDDFRRWPLRVLRSREHSIFPME